MTRMNADKINSEDCWPPAVAKAMADRHKAHKKDKKSFNKKTKIEQALANEIMKAFNRDMDSNAMSKKRDGEKQADSSR